MEKLAQSCRRCQSKFWLGRFIQEQTEQVEQVESASSLPVASPKKSTCWHIYCWNISQEEPLVEVLGA